MVAGSPSVDESLDAGMAEAGRMELRGGTALSDEDPAGRASSAAEFWSRALQKGSGLAWRSPSTVTCCSRGEPRLT